MSLKFSIYELIAYTVPGALFIALIVYVCTELSLCYLDFGQINDLSWFILFFFFVFAYTCGLIVDRFARWWQHRFFRKDENPQVILKIFKERSKDFLNIHFRASD